MEQFQVRGQLRSNQYCPGGGKEATWEQDQADVNPVSQVEDWSWAPVKTKMTLERSYQCSVGLSRSVSGQGESSNHGNMCYIYSGLLASSDDPEYETAIWFRLRSIIQPVPIAVSCLAWMPRNSIVSTSQSQRGFLCPRYDMCEIISMWRDAWCGNNSYVWPVGSQGCWLCLWERNC